jgi:phosphoribosylformylglycinamidine synthase subunit PurS
LARPFSRREAGAAACGSRGATVISRIRSTRSGGVPPTAESASIRIEVRVELKPGVVDAEAESVQKSLGLLGLRSLKSVSTARVFVLEFANLTTAQAENAAGEAVDRLLANPVIHRVAIRPLPD